MNRCTIDGCDRKRFGHGLCERHYRRKRDLGDALWQRPERQPCAVAGCENLREGHGLCSKHYARMRRSGTLNVSRAAPGQPLSWLVDNRSFGGDDCLPWPFASGGDGYGRLTLDGHNRVASRAMCILAHGEPPTPSHQAAHSCGNGDKGCCNPRHLRWATPVQNNADKVDHGTVNRGSRHGNAKISEADVRAIRALPPGTSNAEIARSFGLARTTIADIRSRRRWAWVPD